MVMVSNTTGIVVGHMAATYPGRLGHLFSPGHQRGPWEFMPYALDNGAFIASKHKQEWNKDEWRALLLWAQKSGQPPLWALVPDVVSNREATIERWHRYVPEVRRRGFRPAFAAQDGMTPTDVPSDDCMIFLGGGDEFKDAAIKTWPKRFPGRVHVGRVTGWDRLARCWRAGAVSVDGNGWFHDSPRSNQRGQLRKFLKETTHGDYLAAV